MSVSELVGYIPFREWILLEGLDGLDCAKPVSCDSCSDVCVFNHKRIAYVLLCLERLYKFVWRLFVVSARDFKRGLLAHRDHTCISIAFAREVVIHLCWLLLTRKQRRDAFFCVLRLCLRVFIICVFKHRPLCHFNLSELVVLDDIIILMPDVLILGHPSVFHLTTSIPLCRLTLVRRRS